MTTSPTFSTCTNRKSNTTAMPMAKNDMHQLMQITESGGNSADLVSSSAVTVDTAVHDCIFHGGKDHKFVLISLPDTILPHENARSNTTIYYPKPRRIPRTLPRYLLRPKQRLIPVVMTTAPSYWQSRTSCRCRYQYDLLLRTVLTVTASTTLNQH